MKGIKCVLTCYILNRDGPGFWSGQTLSDSAAFLEMLNENRFKITMNVQMWQHYQHCNCQKTYVICLLKFKNQNKISGAEKMLFKSFLFGKLSRNTAYV